MVDFDIFDAPAHFEVNFQVEHVWRDEQIHSRRPSHEFEPAIIDSMASYASVHKK